MAQPKRTNAENLEILDRVFQLIDEYGNDAILKDYEITQEERDKFGLIVRIVNGMNNWL